MYQYTTTNVINSQYALDYNGNILKDSTNTSVPKYAGSATAFTVAKVGKFLKTGIVNVFKRPYSAGVLEVARVRVPVVASGLALRLDVVLNLSQSTQSEYVNYTLDFLKPVTVEVIASGTAATDAAALVAQLNTLKDRFGYRYFTAAVVSTDYVQITCSQFEQRVKSMTLSKWDTTATVWTNSIVQPQYTDVTASTFSVTTPGALGFGDDNWMQRSIMLQTLENTRYFGISKDERPILGGQYTEYALRYSIPKDGNDGIVGAGTSVTTHIFYVISTQQAAFETALNVTLGSTGVLVTIGGDQDLIIIGDQTVAASAGATQYSVLNAALGETINWTNTVLTGTTSANTTGVLTVGATTGTTTLTATGATSGRVATLVVNVI